MSEFKKILGTIFILLFAVTGVWFFSLSNNKSLEQFVVKPQLKVQGSPIPSPKIVNPTTSSQISPDGTVSLVLKEKPGKTQSDYLFSVIDNEAGKKILYSTKRSTHRTLSIPFNTWSPDNRYIFWAEEAGGKKYYYVLSASEEVMEPIDVVSIFDANDGEYVIEEITGWAAPGLLIANTRKADGSHGPSFWFEVYSQSFIQLSTGFY